VTRANTILLVDDEVGFRENVAERFESRGFRVFQAGEANQALESVRQHVIDVALVDIQMPGMDGIELLGKLKELDPLLEIVMVSGQGSIERAVEAMRLGAYHFVTKPVKLSELELTARRAIEKTLLGRQNRLFRETLRRGKPAPAQPIASSPAMKNILEQAEKIARTNATVLITGETGTGKGMLAEFIHNHSPRKDQPHTVVNCGALSDTLLDAELFGSEKGAFTGATEARPGMIEAADGGTLFLDEIGDMALVAQVRLLRFLFRRVGSARERKVDVRVLAATHADLKTLSVGGEFRQDLYHRLLVFELRLPPLRERGDDIVPLAEHFLSGHVHVAPRSLSQESRDVLQQHSWPGNVRELAHTMERANLAAEIAGAEEISPGHLGLSPASPTTELLISLQDAQRRHVEAVLRRLDGNRQRSAEVLGVSERHLYRLLRRYGSGENA
jgi:two-component system response regulator AtoC